jgi:hypothetical protein
MGGIIDKPSLCRTGEGAVASFELMYFDLFAELGQFRIGYLGMSIPVGQGLSQRKGSKLVVATHDKPKGTTTTLTQIEKYRR